MNSKEINKQEDSISLQTEINNLMQISQALESFPIMGSNNMLGYGSCVRSLNMTISNLIKYNQQECGELIEPNKTDK